MFAAEGATVAIHGRNQTALDVLEKEIASDNPAAKTAIVVGDITTPGACERIVTEAAAALDGLDILVHCAGVLKGGAVDATTLETWSE
jgi:NADP-dependent 3-hydroxy acid dehydrogenase YdfG